MGELSFAREIFQNLLQCLRLVHPVTLQETINFMGQFFPTKNMQYLMEQKNNQKEMVYVNSKADSQQVAEEVERICKKYQIQYDMQKLNNEGKS